MIDSEALRLIPFASHSIQAISRDFQEISFYKVYCYNTGVHEFYIVHQFARIVNCLMLDFDEIVLFDKLHLNPTELPYYGDEYFFFEISPFKRTISDT